MLPGVSMRRFTDALLTVTTPPSVGALKLPRSARSASTTERMPSGIPQVHVLAARRDVELAGHVAVEPDAAAELHASAAHRRRHVVEPDAAGVEVDRAVDGVERVREREVADAAVGDRRAAGKLRLRSGPSIAAVQLRAARAAHVAEEALQDAEVRVARRLQRDALVVQPDGARHAQPRVVADQLQLARS